MQQLKVGGDPHFLHPSVQRLQDRLPIATPQKEAEMLEMFQLMRPERPESEIREREERERRERMESMWRRQRYEDDYW
jgi:hypothetical protein